MKTKLIYIGAVLLLAFASADATSRTAKPSISIQYIAQPNGDYRLFLFGTDRVLVCEEKVIQVVQQGDAINPIVLECKH